MAVFKTKALPSHREFAALSMKESRNVAINLMLNVKKNKLIFKALTTFLEKAAFAKIPDQTRRTLIAMDALFKNAKASYAAGLGMLIACQNARALCKENGFRL